MSNGITSFVISTVPSVNNPPAIELKHLAPIIPTPIPIGILIPNNINNSHKTNLKICNESEPIALITPYSEVL
ncbi:hypothetical protein SDC9_100186 [bioreactor metagenome]|uniref:Uncharacterized protein n=1 Tax=bioreactor metagenome TaxID=1076179 RepID=A0A645AL01_9ZZZZ